MTPLEAFSAPVRTWFTQTFGTPTPPQAEGWPAIQRGEHVLILAPTGSGKTLAAFLCGLDAIFGELAGPQAAPAGVRLLYVSPLKALNNDIDRNLRAPLAGIRAAAERQGQPLPPLSVAVRTGDTPGHLRAQMVKHPPHILITTPESLYLMLTSPRAREMFRSVRTVILDEIHTLAGNKRGAHLALSLERLAHLAAQPIQRIGLSATIRPLDEAARFLGGQHGGVPRPVTIVNASYRKPLDLSVVTVVEDFRDLPGDTIWPSVVPRVLDDIRRHTTTLIFANNRRLAERTADRLNAQLAAEQGEEIPPGSTEALAPGGLARDRGIFAIGAEGPIRAHHGSMSKDARLQMEEDLKAGRLPALVGTSSLELGIDIGAVDVVVQLQSPKSVSQGLQRVGRSGHLVGQTSKGRIYATFREDLLEAAAIARGMLEGDVELTRTPRNPLDVLAQQIVAMVAVDDWPVAALYELVRGAYPYADLPLAGFHSVLDMLTGKYSLDLGGAIGGPAASLRPKIAWDRSSDRLTALPGSRMLALSNAGTIPDTGAYGVYLGDGKTRIGELDEEFVFETRIGDVFLLGSNVWRVTGISDDRLLVADAAGATPRMPFWNGDYPYRPYELGLRIGRFRGELAARIGPISAAPPEGRRPARAEVEAWLQRDYALDATSARSLVAHVERQLDAVGVIASDRTVVVESFQNSAGDGYVVIHSPFGGRVNGAWALALMSALREHSGVTPEAQTNDDGIIFRFPQSDPAFPVDLMRQMTPEAARQRLLVELPDSAVFGARFRMNAGRALLLPRARAGKRTPFWLQRLRARDLLALVKHKGWREFPILVETYRDCMQDVFDLPHLEALLAGIQDGRVRVLPIATSVPSPVAASLLYNFVSIYLYEWDAPKAERQLQAMSLSALLGEGGRASLGSAELSDLLQPEAVAEYVARASRQAPGYQARTLEELAFSLREVGDMTPDEVAGASTADGPALMAALVEQGRAVQMTVLGQPRWVAADLAADYVAAFGLEPASASPRSSDAADRVPQPESAAASILLRYLRRSGPVTRDAVLARYPFAPAWLTAELDRLACTGQIIAGRFSGPDVDEYCEAQSLDHMRRRTLSLLRQAVQPVGPYAYAHFLARWQHAHPAARLAGAVGLQQILDQLSGLALAAELWQRQVLPARLVGFSPSDLPALAAEGEWVWAAAGSRERIRFFRRGQGALFLDTPEDGLAALSERARAVYDFLKAEGASFEADLRAGLGLSNGAVAEALAELAAAGLVTHDRLDSLRAGLTPEPEAPARRRPLSPLESELAQRLGERKRPLTTSRYRAAKQRVAARIQAQLEAKAASAQAAPQAPAGRWSLLHRPGVLGPALAAEERPARIAQVLLARYGVVTRESLERESASWDWADLYPVFQRLELRGEVRRGYFVAGLPGVQFALPEAVEQLRAAPDEAVVILNAADPANVFGGEFHDVDTPRFARLPSTHVALIGGQPLLVFEDNGSRLTSLPGAAPEELQRALSAYLQRPYGPRRVSVAAWNGEPIGHSPHRALLRHLGFQNTPSGMEWWAGH
jgi:ATP-dependent helicase Lhr and Lhr-like helicase